VNRAGTSRLAGYVLNDQHRRLVGVIVSLADHAKGASRPPCMVSHMSRQALGNAAAGILFLIVAIVDFTRDSSGIGVVFVVFAAVFLGLAASARKSASAR
jgi:hypothetical protein